MIKKFTFAGAFLAAAGPLSGCAHVRQEDLAEWAGQPVDLLDKHPVFLTMRSVRTMTADGTEIRNYVNEAAVIMRRWRLCFQRRLRQFSDL